MTTIAEMKAVTDAMIAGRFKSEHVPRYVIGVNKAVITVDHILKCEKKFNCLEILFLHFTSSAPLKRLRKRSDAEIFRCALCVGH